MKFCRECNFENNIRAEECAACGHGFGTPASGNAPLAAQAQAQAQAGTSARPTGWTPMLIGWACLAMALLLFLAALSQQPNSWETSPYASPTSLAAGAEKVARAASLQFAAGGFFSLFLALWSVGYIVNAISYLPGKKS